MWKRYNSNVKLIPRAIAERQTWLPNSEVETAMDTDLTAAAAAIWRDFCHER